MRWIRHLIGVATLIATIMGGFYLWSLLDEGSDDPGFPLTLIFESTEGLREGARVTYRGVTVGEVRHIRLDAGGVGVRVECRLKGVAAGSARANSRFWIVRPVFLGLTEGASGLDTLIKDSYVAYDTPDSEGRPAPPLAPASRVPGLDRAPIRNLRGAIDRERPGDLRFSVAFGENNRLVAGSRVRHRGMDVGVVERIVLSPAGDGVWVTARVDRSYRETVRSGSQFWIARPTAAANWTTGVEVHDLDALLGGAYLAYFSPADDAPATDEHRFRGLAKRPEIDWPDPSLAAHPDAPPDGVGTPGSIDPSLVRIFYDFTEKDLLSPDDRYQFESIGVAFTTRDGFAAVLTH